MIQKRDIENKWHRACLPTFLPLAAIILFFLAMPTVSQAQIPGVNWAQVTSNAAFGARFNHSTVVFNGRLWAIGGYTGSVGLGDVWYSSDGANWICANSNAPFGQRGNSSMAVFNGKMWLIGGSNGSPLGDVWSSPDGVNWTRATANAAFGGRWCHETVVFNNKMWGDRRFFGKHLP